MAQSQLPLLTLLLTSELSRRFPTLVLPFEILLPPAARSSFPSYFPFCFCSLLLQRRAVATLLSPGEVHGVVLCIALVFLSFLRFLLYSVDWTSVGHSLRCGSLGLETSTLNSFVDADRRFTDPSIYDKTLWPQHRLRPPNFGLL